MSRHWKSAPNENSLVTHWTYFLTLRGWIVVAWFGVSTSVLEDVNLPKS